MSTEITKLVAPETEAEITKHWKYIDKVYTSVICITFNQDIYIRDAIDSFLAQVTEYKFEIIIHDDVSTDSTREILKEYQQKYPSIIKLILQETNQFSININMPFKHSLAIAEGEYIALCEGDDFWLIRDKIDKQVKLLLSNVVNICFTSAKFLYPDNSVGYKCKSSIYKHASIEDVILGGGAYMPTASLMIKKSVILSLPDWFYLAPVGDYFLQVIASSDQGALYDDCISCCYRVEADGAWSTRVKYYSCDFYMIFLRSINDLNKHLECKYDTYFDALLKNRLYTIMVNAFNNRDYRELIRVVLVIGPKFPLNFLKVIFKISHKLFRKITN